MKTLLEKAKSIKMKRVQRSSFSSELLELTLAYVRDEVTIGQVAMALGQPKHHSAGPLQKMTKVLKSAYQAGIITITEKK